jgi:hypothetical protein
MAADLNLSESAKYSMTQPWFCWIRLALSGAKPSGAAILTSLPYCAAFSRAGDTCRRLRTGTDLAELKAARTTYVDAEADENEWSGV